MTPFFRYFLLFYFIVGILVLAARFFLLKQSIGKSAAVRPNTETVEGLLNFYFSVLMLFTALVVLIVSLLPQFADYLVPIDFLGAAGLKLSGCVILIVSLIWIFVGQHQMRRSWQFGIQEEKKTELVRAGLFRISRNPIYVGTLAMLAGLFLVFSSAATLLILVVGYVMTQMQIRLEEQYLTKHHGDAYLDYKKKVRRLI